MKLHSQQRLKYAASINDEALGEDTSPDFDIRYVDISNVDSLGTIHDVVDYTFEKAPSRARRLVRNGDVIISTVRTYLQAIAPIQEPPENLIVSTGFAVLRPRPGQLDPSYCKYVLRESRFLWEVITRSVGVSYPAINASDLGDIRIPLPPLDAQRRVADYLDRETARIDALIAAKERLLAILAEKRRAFITHAVTRGLNPDAPLKDSGLPWLGKVPEHWRVHRLKFHMPRIEQGWSPQCDNFPANDDEWGVLKVGAVNGWEFNPLENKRLPLDLNPLVEYEIRAGDVLMSRANTTQLLGLAALVRSVRPKLIFCDKHYRLTLNKQMLNSEFLILYLRSTAGHFEFERDATGASNSMQNIGQDSVQNVWVPLPPIPEQECITAYIAEVTGQIDAMEAANVKTVGLLRERRSALIAAAVTGELSVEG